MSHWYRLSSHLMSCCLALVSICTAQSKTASHTNAPSALNCDNPPDFSTFVNCRIDQLTDQITKKAEVTAAQKDPAKNAQAPSSAATASSLIDKSSVSDLASMTLDAAGLSSASSQPNTTSTTGSVTAYALRNWIEKKDSLDPSIYSRGLNWRRFSLLLGRDLPDSSKTTGSGTTSGSSAMVQGKGLAPFAASTEASTTGPTTSQRGVIIGGKAVIWARRDASNSHNASLFDKIGTALASEVTPSAAAILAITKYLDEEYGANSTTTNWGGTLSKLTDTDKQHIDTLLGPEIEASVQYYKVVSKVLTTILMAPQISTTYQADVKLDNGGTLHRFAFVFDKSAFGTSGKVLTSSNVGFDYTEKSSTTAAKKQFRASGDLQFPLWSNQKGKTSKELTLDVSGQGQWGSKAPVYQTQLKLSIPLLTGVSIPLTCGYANQTQLLKETNVFGHVGITLDFGKILEHSKP